MVIKKDWEKTIRDKTPDIRFLYDMKEVIYDQKWLDTTPNLELYYMYRGVERQGYLRYDITLMPPHMLGEEYVKTKGNCNSEEFQELYMVLEGKALFLMQKRNNNYIEDAVVVEVKEGECVIIPAQYTVVTINHTDKMLKMSNWVSDKNQNVYKEIEKKKGACYFYTKSGWIQNRNYTQVPPLRFKNSLQDVPKDLSFLE